jgi:hypothetical protein
MKGQFFFVDQPPSLFFAASLWLTSSDEALKLGISFADFAPHDPVKDMLFLTDVNKQSMEEAGKVCVCFFFDTTHNPRLQKIRKLFRKVSLPRCLL